MNYVSAGSNAVLNIFQHLELLRGVFNPLLTHHLLSEEVFRSIGGRSCITERIYSRVGYSDVFSTDFNTP